MVSVNLDDPPLYLILVGNFGFYFLHFVISFNCWYNVVLFLVVILFFEVLLLLILSDAVKHIGQLLLLMVLYK